MTNDEAIVIRKPLRFLLLAVAACLVLLLTGGALLYQATRHVPEFYQRALEVSPQQQAAAGDELERQVLELHSEIQDEGRWQAVFDEDQINGWLASDLTEKFSTSLPTGVSEPRVSISPESVQLACRYQDSRIDTVVSLKLALAVNPQSNEVAITVQNVRAGLLPLPLKELLDQVAAAARRAELDLRWVQSDGAPVALLRVPAEIPSLEVTGFQLEKIDLGEGEIRLIGQTAGQR